MKNIKSINEYNNQKLYEPVGSTKFFDLLKKKKYIRNTDEIYKKISDEYSSLFYSKIANKEWIGIQKKDGFDIKIFKLDDEYYLVLDTPHQHYKCDEIEGVMDLLKTLL